MTTAYTSLLGLALPVTGELQGTWGDVVNNSITSLLDTAVAGTTTLGTDADVTLTTTTGASNQARQAILLCSGARTGIRNITAPAASKAYIVINATTGGYAVVVRGTGPTTGVTISNGEKCLIAWNGSDFVKTSSTIANAGGSNTQVQFNSGGVLAGNSNFVFDGTNVGIGTASPAQIVEASLSQNGKTQVKVTNVNAGASASAGVLFGTSSGENGYIGANGGAASSALGGANAVQVANLTANPLVLATNATERMRIDSSGNVLVGTTTPRNILTVTGPNAAAPTLGTASGTALFCPAGTTYGTMIGSAAGGQGWIQQQRVDTTATAYDLWLQPSGGNVGVGTTSPSAKLEVNGNAAVQAGGKLLVGATTTTAGAGVQTFGPDSSANISAKRYSNDTTGVTIQGIKTRGTSASSLTTVAAGDNLVSFVGGATQGTGTVPVVALDISVDPNGTVSATSVPGVLTVGIVPNGSLGVGVERLRIDMNGNMGLGTNNPLARFDVFGSQASNIVTVAALDIDCSTGNYFIKTINGASTFTFSNPPAGRAYAFTLELTQTSGAVTWPASVKWPNNTAPTLTAGNTQLFTFITDDGGARWRGSSLINYPN